MALPQTLLVVAFSVAVGVLLTVTEGDAIGLKALLARELEADRFGVMRYVAGEIRFPRNALFAKTVLPLYDTWALDFTHDEFVAQVGGMDNDTVLELGCGNGRSTKKFIKSFQPFKAYCLDLSPIQNERARGVLAEEIASGVAEVARGDASSLPYDDDTFDVVFSYNLVNIFQDYNKTLAESWRVLKNDGLLAVCWRPSDTWDMRWLASAKGKLGFWTIPPYALETGLFGLSLTDDQRKATNEYYECLLKIKGGIKVDKGQSADFKINVNRK
jgi:SAM-dependent methyltransferase